MKNKLTYSSYLVVSILKFLLSFFYSQNALPNEPKLDENIENYFKVDDSGEPINEFPPEKPKGRDVNDDFDIPDDEITFTKRTVSSDGSGTQNTWVSGFRSSKAEALRLLFIFFPTERS